MKPEDIAELKQLIDFLKENQVAEFDLDRGDLKIRLKFSPQVNPSSRLGDLGRLMDSSAAAKAHPVSAAASAAPLAAPQQAPAVEPAADSGLHIVNSPIVGTFFSSPSPDAAPFVATGDRVEKGQVICVVEAMKLMNEIEADASGEIVKCLVENGQPIEYGQPLFSMRTA